MLSSQAVRDPPSFVRININYGDSDQNVSEHQVARFRCKSIGGQPYPTVSLVKKDNDTVLLTYRRRLFHTMVSRCEDSGQYQCTAENGVGPIVTSNLRSLFVQCSPRGPQDLGDVHFINAPLSTTFDVTAYPAPTQVTFTFLGPTGNSTQPSAVDESQIQLAGDCQAKAGGAIYLFTCTVTVTSVTSETAAGVYQVNVTNSQGDGQFRLQVLYKAATSCAKCAKCAPGASHPDLAIGVSVALGVVLFVVVTIIVTIVIWLWRRQWKLPCADVGNDGDSKSQPAVDPDDNLEPVPRVEEAPGVLYENTIAARE
ncbi:hypothetical protein ACOMHN_013266 [Nucella lapillus]